MAGRAEARKGRRRAEQSLWSQRLRALLAGGLVLGVGATVTMATWNDSEYAGGSVTAGTFELQGSSDGSDFWSSEADSPHALSFTPDSGPLFPGATRHALFSVRTAEGSIGGTVQVLADEGNDAGLGAYLTYGLSVIEGTTCDAGTFEDGNTVVERGTVLTEGAQAAQELAADQGAAVNYCLELLLPEDADNGAQGEDAAPSWQFLGTSSSE